MSPQCSHALPTWGFNCFYHNGVAVDAVTEQLQAIAGAQWRFTIRLGRRHHVRLVQDDQIDLLVDMSGHVEHNFLTAFARKPAPVQLSWAAYPATTGLSSIDYVITDPTLWPLLLSSSTGPSSPVICPTALWCTNRICAIRSADKTRLTPSAPAQRCAKAG